MFSESLLKGQWRNDRIRLLEQLSSQGKWTKKDDVVARKPAIHETTGTWTVTSATLLVTVEREFSASVAAAGGDEVAAAVVGAAVADVNYGEVPLEPPGKQTINRLIG